MSVKGLTRVAAFKALRAGEQAGKAGKPITACPYDANGDLLQRWLTRFWLRGWNAEKPREGDTNQA